MVELQKGQIIITLDNDFNAETLQDYQNSLITAIVELASNRDLDYERQAFCLGELLKGLQPSTDVLQTGFDNTPKG